MKIKNLKFQIILLGVVIVFHTQMGIVFAQEPTLSPTPKPVEYTLPYPGLLPDNPLYFLRAIRDTMQGMMVSNPLKKADYYLLQADKGISASSVLSQKKETAVLASATADEALEYYDKSLNAVISAKKQGLDTHGITNQLVLANHKHQEVLAQIRRGVRTTDQQKFVQAEQKARDLGKKARTLLPAK
jgi:hypothetical protein